MEQRDPAEPHWHIGPISVHRERRGCGVGGAPLRSFLERVDELRGLAEYLATDVDRIALYEKLGFAVDRS